MAQDAGETIRWVRRPLVLAAGIALVLALSLLAGRVARTRAAVELADSAAASLATTTKPAARQRASRSSSSSFTTTTPSGPSTLSTRRDR